VLLFGYALCHCPFPGCTRAKETSLFVWQNQAASLATTRPRAYRRAVAPCVRSIVVTCYWSRVVTGTPHGSSLHQAASPRTTTPRKSHHAPSSRRQRASSSLGWPKIGPPVGCTAPTAASDLGMHARSCSAHTAALAAHCCPCASPVEGEPHHLLVRPLHRVPVEVGSAMAKLTPLPAATGGRPVTGHGTAARAAAGRRRRSWPASVPP
jgi:hypothetical protein